MIAAGADPNIKNNEGFSPLIISAEIANSDVVSLLVDSEAKIDAVNNRNESAIWVACCYGREEEARILLKAGAVLDVRNCEGFTPLEVATYNNNGGIVEMLEAEIKRRKKRESDKERKKKKKKEEQGLKKKSAAEAAVKLKSIEVDGFEFVDIIDEATSNFTGLDLTAAGSGVNKSPKVYTID